VLRGHGETDPQAVGGGVGLRLGGEGRRPVGGLAWPRGDEDAVDVEPLVFGEHLGEVDLDAHRATEAQAVDLEGDRAWPSSGLRPRLGHSFPSKPARDGRTRMAARDQESLCLSSGPGWGRSAEVRRGPRRTSDWPGPRSVSTLRTAPGTVLRTALRAAACRHETRDHASANRLPESFVNCLEFARKGLPLAR
jgi:hypothetical protein